MFIYRHAEPSHEVGTDSHQLSPVTDLSHYTEFAFPHFCRGHLRCHKYSTVFAVAISPYLFDVHLEAAQGLSLVTGAQEVIPSRISPQPKLDRSWGVIP